MNSRITLRDVAKAADLSVATVSQALRGDPRTARATRERVQRMAMEMGYRPDPVLARLAAKRFRETRALKGTPLVFATHHRTPAAGRKWRYLDELTERAGERGYRLRHVPIDSPEKLRHEARRWYHQCVRGVIFGLLEHDEWYEEIDWSPFCVLMLGGRCPRVLFNTVKGDVVLATKWALARLETAAEGRLGVFLYRHEHRLIDDELREGVARNWIEQLPKARRVPLLIERFETPYDEQMSRVRAWLAEHRPAGIASLPLGFQLLGDLGYFADTKRRFVSLMHDVHDQRPGLAGCLGPTRQEAYRAIDMLDGMIRHGETGRPEQPVQILVPPIWLDAGDQPAVERPSTASLRG